MQEAIAIDLGTANTLIIHNDKVVVDEPSIVARNISVYFWVVKSCILAKVTYLSIQNLKNLDCNSH